MSDGSEVKLMRYEQMAWHCHGTYKDIMRLNYSTRKDWMTCMFFNRAWRLGVRYWASGMLLLAEEQDLFNKICKDNTKVYMEGCELLSGLNLIFSQVISNTATLKLLNGEPLEVAITRNAKHRNVVNTLDYAISNGAAESDSECGEEKFDSVMSQAKRSHDSETWMLLEFCDCGCLQVQLTPLK